jgi:hypothetical protein
MREKIQAADEAEDESSDEENALQSLLESVEDTEALLETIPGANAILDLTLLGSLSLDGSKLLFMRWEPSDRDLIALLGDYQENLVLTMSLSALIEDEDEQQDSRYYLYLIDLESGEDPALLSSETTWVPSFAFSPDGTQILFESNLYGRSRALYLADAENRARQRISEGGVEAFCWR